MSKTKYPQYRVSQWLDTSEDAMNKLQASITYGVQIMQNKGSKWLHCANGSEPLFFDSLETASAACDELRRGLVIEAGAKEAA